MIWGQAAHQLGGAAGSLASLGDKAEAVSEAFARTMPSIGAVRVPWHSERRRPARIATELGRTPGDGPIPYIGKTRRRLNPPLKPALLKPS